MDTLTNISTGVPEWLQKLESLDHEIKERQMKLSKSYALATSCSTCTEQDGQPTSPISADPITATPTETAQSREIGEAGTQIRARRAARGQKKSMILVYYDEETDRFFKELAEFVSKCQGKIKRAKLAQKVATILLAEQHTSEEDDDGGQLGAIAMKDRGGRELRSESAAIYDELSQVLEIAQMQAETAVYDFFKNGECSEGIGMLGQELSKAKALAVLASKEKGSNQPHAPLLRPKPQ